MIFIEHDMDMSSQDFPKDPVLCYGSLLAEGTPADLQKSKSDRSLSGRRV